MDTPSTTPAEVAPVPPPPATAPDTRPALPAHVAAGLAAYHAGDPDGPTVRVLAARRDLGCSGSGPEEYRRVRYPGATSEVWPDGDRLPACNGRAGTRRCSVDAEVPIGSLIVCYTRDVYKGRRGRCSVEIKLVCPPSETEASQRRGYTAIVCPHRTLRSRPVYEVTLPDGSLVEVARREG